MAVSYNSNLNNAIVPKLPTVNNYNPNTYNSKPNTTNPNEYLTKALGILPVDVRYLSNPTNGLAYNSFSDILLNDAAWNEHWNKPGTSWLTTPIGYLPRVIADSVSLLKHQSVDPVVNSIKDYGLLKGLGVGASTATLNALTNLGNTLDILSNPIKGLVLEGTDGFIKGLYGDTAGRKQYNYNDYINFGDGLIANTGEFLASMALETLSDPMTYVSAGISSLGKSGGQMTAKTLADITNETAEALTKAGTKAITEEVAEESIGTLNLVTKKVTSFITETGDDATAIVKDIASKYGADISDDVATDLLHNLVTEEGVSEALLKKAKSATDQMGSMINKAAVSDNTKELSQLSEMLRSRGSLTRAAYAVDDNNFLTAGLQNYYASLLNNQTLSGALQTAVNLQKFQNGFYKTLRTPIMYTTPLGFLGLGKKGATKLITKIRAAKQIAKMAATEANVTDFLNATNYKINFDGEVTDVTINKLPTQEAKQYNKTTRIVEPDNKPVTALLAANNNSTNTGLTVVETVDSNIHEMINEQIDTVLDDFTKELYQQVDTLTQESYKNLRQKYIDKLNIIVSTSRSGKAYPFADFDTYCQYINRIDVFDAPAWVKEFNKKLKPLNTYFASDVDEAFLYSLNSSITSHANNTIEKLMKLAKSSAEEHNAEVVSQELNLKEVDNALNLINRRNNKQAPRIPRSITEPEKVYAKKVFDKFNNFVQAEDYRYTSDVLFDQTVDLQEVATASNNIQRYHGTADSTDYILYEELHNVDGDPINVAPTVKRSVTNKEGFETIVEERSGIFSNDILQQEYETLVASIEHLMIAERRWKNLLQAYGYISEDSDYNIAAITKQIVNDKTFRFKSVSNNKTKFNVKEARDAYYSYVSQLSETMSSYETMVTAIDRDVNKLFDKVVKNNTDLQKYKQASERLIHIDTSDIRVIETANVQEIVDLGLINYGTMVSKRKMLDDLLYGSGKFDVDEYILTNNLKPGQKPPIVKSKFARLFDEYNSDNSELKHFLTVTLKDDVGAQSLVNTLNNIKAYKEHVNKLNKILIGVPELHKRGIIDGFITQLEKYNAFDEHHLEDTIQQIIDTGDLLVSSRFNVPKLSLEFQLRSAAERVKYAPKNSKVRMIAHNLLERLDNDTAHNAAVDVDNLADMIAITPVLKTAVKNAANGRHVLYFDIETTGTKNSQMFQLSAKLMDSEDSTIITTKTYNIRVPIDQVPEQLLLNKLSPGLSGEEAKNWFIKEFVDNTGTSNCFESRREALNAFVKDFNLLDESTDYLFCGHNIRNFDLPQLVDNTKYNTAIKNMFQNIIDKHNYFDTYTYMQLQHMWRIDDLTRTRIADQMRKLFRNSTLLQDGSPRHKLIDFNTLLDLQHVKQTIIADNLKIAKPVKDTIEKASQDTTDIIATSVTIHHPLSNSTKRLLENGHIDYFEEAFYNETAKAEQYRITFPKVSLNKEQGAGLIALLSMQEPDLADATVDEVIFHNVRDTNLSAEDIVLDAAKKSKAIRSAIHKDDSELLNAIQDKPEIMNTVNLDATLFDDAISNLREVWTRYTGKAADTYTMAANVFNSDELNRLVLAGKINLPYGARLFSAGTNIMQTLNKYIVDEDMVILQPYKMYSHEFANSFDPKKIIDYYAKHSPYISKGEAPVRALRNLTRASQSISKVRTGLTKEAVDVSYENASKFLEFYSKLDPDITSQSYNTIKRNQEYIKFLYDADDTNKALTVASAIYIAGKDKSCITDETRELYNALQFENIYNNVVKPKIKNSNMSDYNNFISETSERTQRYYNTKATNNRLYNIRKEYRDALYEQATLEKDSAKNIKQSLRDSLQQRKQNLLNIDKETAHLRKITSADEAAKRIWTGELGSLNDFVNTIEDEVNDPFMLYKHVYEDKNLLSATQRVKSTAYGETHKYTQAYNTLLQNKSKEEQDIILNQMQSYDAAYTQAGIYRILNREDRVNALKSEVNFTGGRTLFVTDQPVDISDFTNDKDLVTCVIPYQLPVNTKSNPVYKVRKEGAKDAIERGVGFNVVKPTTTDTVYIHFIGVKNTAYTSITKQTDAMPGINVLSKSLDPELQDLLTAANKQFNGAVSNAGCSTGDIVTTDLLYNVDKFLPEGIVDQLIPVYKLESEGFFNTLKGNNTVFGNANIQRLFNNYYASNRFNRIAYAVKYNIDTQVDSLTLMLNFMCNNENGIATQEVFSKLTNTEIRDLMKAHPDWKLIWVGTNDSTHAVTKSGFVIHEIQDFSDKSLEAARKINAHFVPADLAYTIQQSVNNFELVGSLKYIQQLSQAYKLGYIGSFGTMMRNFIDSNHKNRMDMYHTFKLPKQISRLKGSFEILRNYQDIQLEYVKVTGKILRNASEYRALYTICTSSAEHVDELIAKDNPFSKYLIKVQGTLNDETINKIKNKLLNPELFEFTDNFINNAPSAGMYRNVLNELPNDSANKNILKWFAEESPMHFLYDGNEMVEQCVRFSRYIEELQANKSLSEASLAIMKTHFDYADKSLLMIYTELVFPFMSFSFKNLNYWLETVMNNAPAMFELENIMRTILDYHSLFNPDYEAYNAYDYRFDFEKELKCQSRIPWQMINAARLYHALNGNIAIDSDKKVTRDRGYGEQDLELYSVFKLSPSFLDAVRLLTNPMTTYQERMLPPAEALANLIPDILEGKQPLDSISISSLANMLPFFGANSQRYGLGNTNNVVQRVKDLGIPQLAASVLTTAYVPIKDYNTWYNENFERIGGFKSNYKSKRYYNNAYNTKVPNYVYYKTSRPTNKAYNMYGKSKRSSLYDYRYNSMIKNRYNNILNYRLRDYARKY